MARRPSFRGFLQHRATIQRSTSSATAMKFESLSWSNIYTNQRCTYWLDGQNAATDSPSGGTPHLRRDAIANYLFAFESDLGLYQDDRIVIGSDTWMVLGVAMDYSNDRVGVGPYIVKAQRKVNY